MVTAGYMEERMADMSRRPKRAAIPKNRLPMMSKRPARIIDRLVVDCVRPRDRTGTACNAVRRKVLAALQAEKSDMSSP